jgi:hypothetical protein
MAFPIQLFSNWIWWEFAAVFWGFSIGVILPHLIIYTWAWFPIRQVALRVFAWSIFMANLDSLMIETLPMLYAVDHVAVPLVFFYLGTSGSGIIGLPQDVTWLDAPKRLQALREAVLGKPTSAQERSCWSLLKVLPPKPHFCDSC